MTVRTRRWSVPARLWRQGGDAGWTFASQGLSAASNLLVSIAAGRAGGEELLGGFTLGFTVYLLLLSFSRALFSEPLMSLAADDDDTPERAALTCVVAWSLAGGAVVAGVGALASSSTLLAVALVMPALLGQDLLRYAAFRRRRARRSAVLDGIWFAALLLAWPLLVSASSPAVLVLIWGGGAALALLWGLRRTPPIRARGAWRWWHRDARHVGGLLAVDSAVSSVTGQGVVFGLAAVLGTAELGRLRAAQVLLGPASTALVAFNAFVLPRLASRAASITSRQAMGLCALAAGTSGLAVGVSVVAAPLVEDLFFGGRLEVPRLLVVLVGLSMVVLGAGAGLVLHLKVLRDLGPFTVVHGCASVVGVPLVLGAAWFGGLEGAAWALLGEAVLVTTADLAAWRYTLRRRAGGDVAATAG